MLAVPSPLPWFGWFLFGFLFGLGFQIASSLWGAVVSFLKAHLAGPKQAT